MRFLICGIALGGSLALAAPSMAAEKVGIAACDDFLDKYEVCVKDKVPAAQRASYGDQVNQLRSTWKQMITSSPETKAELEGACKQMMESMKAALSGSYGCTF
jgi:hypothetical protein